MAESCPLFVISGVDWTPYITVPNFSVNLKPEYDEWKDANRTKHRDVIRYYLEGTFTVKCPDLATYYAIMDSLYAAEDTYGGYYLVDGIYAANNQQYLENVELFIELEDLQNEEPILGTADSEGFEVSVIER